MNRFLLPFFLLFSITFSIATAQKKIVNKKYPSLFWEIKGNGLQKPSYLFGTMHVSSKMVFHLSDSFYQAMRSTDAVALELNPEVWQDEMFRLQNAQVNLSQFSLNKSDDYLSENSFRLEKYEDNIKRALSTEPAVVNNLLYRTYEPDADFEENTYLDLYIYQTGRKLGKRAAGVENYLESEKLMMQAFKDMAKDKSYRHYDNEGESYIDVQQKIQQAYRNGDLDLLDSLQAISINSVAFYEKFLYLRNEIQANSIDTIVRRHSLFVSVGAAHLPGTRGVIELLRKKGYHLRPIFMQDRDAVQKEEIDKLRVPVAFRQVSTPDGDITMDLPGSLYKREDAGVNESWQYADMNNGSYYMLTRVKTHAALWGHTAKAVYEKVDSMLYESIPGKILKKGKITKNGYPGFDIVNRTRRGDMQRYQVLITPYEALVFKISGIDNYVEGAEADHFFNSIIINNTSTAAWSYYEPPAGGFTVKLPSAPQASFARQPADGAGQWNYESIDDKNGDAYSIYAKNVYNFHFLEQDTFNLALTEESFKKSGIIDRQLSRKTGTENNIKFLETSYLLKGNEVMYTRAFIKGTRYYLLLARLSKDKLRPAAFFNSFTFTDYRYPQPVLYTDSALKLEVVTPVVPGIDTMLRSLMETTGAEASAYSSGYSGWPKSKTGVFKNDSTGERVFVTVQSFPKYYYSRDTARFWRDRLEEKETLKDLVFTRKQFFKRSDSSCGYNVVLTDTGSSQCIRYKYLLKGSSMYKFATITDTAVNQSSFINSFFATAKPLATADTFSIFADKLNLFFKDLYSKDSATGKQAAQAIPSIYFGKNGVEKLVAAINRCRRSDKDYFETKTKLIAELGYINDSTSNERVVQALRGIFEKSGDTSYFQNPVLSALARTKTVASFILLKNLLVQDPPVFDDAGDYERIFSECADTPSLARCMFPGIMQLSAIDDYRPHVYGLLKVLVDSGYIKGEDYESSFSTLYFNAKIELKKQQNKDVKDLEENNDEDNDADSENGNDYNEGYHKPTGSGTLSLNDYALLLLPFYTTHPAVPKFFDNLLASKDGDVKFAAMGAMLKQNISFADSLLLYFAAKNQYRAALYNLLHTAGKAQLFPQKYKTQELMAKSLLLGNRSKDFYNIQLLKKKTAQTKDAIGNVYFFRYKMKKTGNWKIGISGLQPVDEKKVNAQSQLVRLTNVNVKASEPELNQFEEQLKKLLFQKRKSSMYFFEHGNDWNYANNGNND